MVWCVTLLEQVIPLWEHCCHEGVNLVCNNGLHTRFHTNISDYSIGKIGTHVFQGKLAVHDNVAATLLNLFNSASERHSLRWE